MLRTLKIKSASISFEFFSFSECPLANPPIINQIVLKLIPENLSPEVFADRCEKIMNGLKLAYGDSANIQDSWESCCLAVPPNFTKAQVPFFADVVLQAARNLKTINNIPMHKIVHDEIHADLADIGINVPVPAHSL
jgi:hypothetical protein